MSVAGGGPTTARDARRASRGSGHPAVALHEVHKRFGDTRAVDDVSLEIDQGEFLALIGPSGCGKTTTLRLIAGMEQPTAGEILIGGKLMNGVQPYHRDVATVWQHFALFPHYDVATNVEFGLRMQRVAKATRRERAEQMLAKLRLEGYGSRGIAQLSGGQKQRVGLARALVTDPSVLLLDEPLGSLDAALGVAVQSELKSLQRELGITFVYVTHNQSEALAMADRIAVMNDGRIEQLGTPNEIYRTPKTRFVAEFVGTNNLVDGVVADYEPGLVIVEVGPTTYRVACGDADRPRLGTQVTFGVRADLVTIVAQPRDVHWPAEVSNLVVGRVLGEEYLGSAVVFTVRTADGLVFKLAVQHKEQLVMPRLDEQVTLGWQAGDAVLLPSAPDGSGA
jgi:spermidine/putrescine transport system ATP-binding protein